MTIPSSPPDTIKGSFLFQCITLTSVSCALVVIIHALSGLALTSHTRIVLSTEQLANTCREKEREREGGRGEGERGRKRRRERVVKEEIRVYMYKVF